MKVRCYLNVVRYQNLEITEVIICPYRQNGDLDGHPGHAILHVNRGLNGDVVLTRHGLLLVRQVHVTGRAAIHRSLRHVI